MTLHQSLSVYTWQYYFKTGWKLIIKAILHFDMTNILDYLNLHFIVKLYILMYWIFVVGNKRWHNGYNLIIVPPNGRSAELTYVSKKFLSGELKVTLHQRVRQKWVKEFIQCIYAVQNCLSSPAYFTNCNCKGRKILKGEKERKTININQTS